MTIADYDELFLLWSNTSGIGINDDDSKDGIHKYLLRNPDTCFVAEEGTEIVGAIMSGHDGRRGYIYHTAVSMSERSKGIGSELVRHATDALANEGIKKVALVAFSNNITGNSFWEKQGFSVRDDLIYRNKNIIDKGAVLNAKKIQQGSTGLFGRA